MVEKIVTSLEVSKKLKDLGIIQESCFYWVKLDTGWEVACGNEISYVYDQNEIDSPNGGEYTSEYTEKISAFTVTELGAMYGNLFTDEPYVNMYPTEEANREVIYWLTESMSPKKYLKIFNQNFLKWRGE
jgi:hypothetical protein